MWATLFLLYGLHSGDKCWNFCKCPSWILIKISNKSIFSTVSWRGSTLSEACENVPLQPLCKRHAASPHLSVERCVKYPCTLADGCVRGLPLHALEQVFRATTATQKPIHLIQYSCAETPAPAEPQTGVEADSLS